MKFVELSLRTNCVHLVFHFKKKKNETLMLGYNIYNAFNIVIDFWTLKKKKLLRNE